MAQREKTYVRLLLAWMVHLFTASGAVFGLLAIQASAEKSYVAALAWMMVSAAIDAVDGALARAFRVKFLLPRFDGALLDNMVDYFNYVIVPAYFLLQTELVPASWRLALASIMVLTSAYQFSQADAKTEDHSFTGFPSYWNIAVFYLFLLDMPEWINAAILMVCAMGVFIPVRYLYPSRTPVLRPLNVLLGCLWAGLAITALVRYPTGHRPALIWSTSYMAYYLVFSLWLTVRKRLAMKNMAGASSEKT